MSPSEKAFLDWCRQPDIDAALRQAGKVSLPLVLAAFMAGALHATERCQAAGHNTKARPAHQGERKE